MAGKSPVIPNFTSQCSLLRSLLAISALTLITFTFLSLKSLSFPPTTPPTPTTTSQVDISDAFHDPEVFRLNYLAMEREFKVFVYPDGDHDTYFQTPRKLTGKYASEGYFFQNIRESRRFRTDDPDRAHLFFIPISCHKMRGKGTSYENMTVIVENYVQSLIMKYPYWNRTLGADHFFVTCHDVGVRATEGLPFLVKNSIRVVCSPSYDVGFIPHKDVALPQVLQPFALPAGGNDIENRTTLGFWSGHRNSKIRVILARVWENDTELYVVPKSIVLELRIRFIMDVYQVQKHFQWNSPPVRFDAFHMIMYELWLRRHVVKY
ncbi:hypothetical protein Sjap_017129 [Stephania japonica]|uniref:Exostosin GT47 domain-containing protein n=1 Tax=Stephania japonica TaxID=461633 RepID=A0AAP0I5L0_9MAGN